MSLPHHIALVAFALGLILAALAIGSIVRQGLAHRRLARGLHAQARSSELAGRPVGIVPGAAIAPWRTFGARRPSCRPTFSRR